MDYEKAYKKALETARDFLDFYKDNPVQAQKFIDIFPELAESEDERIRKYLIEELKAVKSVGELKYTVPQPTREECIAYLERHKESLHISEMCKENSDSFTGAYKDVMVAIEKYLDWLTGYPDYAPKGKYSIRDMLYCLSVLEKPNEQKHPNGCFTCDEYKKGYESGRFHGFTAGYNKAMKEQKSAEWSEEDEDMLNSCISSIEEARENRYAYKETDGDTSYDREINWLKSLRPQPKKNCSDCSKNLEGYISGRTDAENKLLEQFGVVIMPEGELRMKPRWEPSEEQMEALEKAIIRVHSDDEIPILTELRDKLKKL